MKTYTQTIPNLPPEVDSTPDFAGFKFSAGKVRITTSNDSAGVYLSLADMNDDQIKCVADFAGMLCEIGGLGQASIFEDLVKENAAILKAEAEAADPDPGP